MSIQPYFLQDASLGPFLSCAFSEVRSLLQMAEGQKMPQLPAARIFREVNGLLQPSDALPRRRPTCRRLPRTTRAHNSKLQVQGTHLPYGMPGSHFCIPFRSMSAEACLLKMSEVPGSDACAAAQCPGRCGGMPHPLPGAARRRRAISMGMQQAVPCGQWPMGLRG